MNNTWVVLRLPPDETQQPAGDWAEPPRVRGNRPQASSAIALARKDYVQTRYNREVDAQTAAKELAKKEPTVPFAVMGICMIFETTEPKVVQKTFNDAGELVLKDKETIPAVRV